ncbi:DNA polymerase III subunit beta [Legionella sp. D16C41]|uniref:DNA polymerase III subunit beta n=1 Tax=Legionella sp. D16C41 TaxID=3402688 RepID=UPI003AF83DA8
MFEIAIPKNELLPRLLMVAGAVDKRQSLAILANILITIKQKRLVLTATDLEMEISAFLNCDECLMEGEITVPAKKFIDIIRSLDEEAIPTIKLDENAVVLKAGRSKFKLATLPAEQFPNSDQEQPDIELTLPRAELLWLLQSTHFAMSQQDVRVFLNGLLFELEGNAITTVATDGHRMAICKHLSQQTFPSQRLLIPRKGIQEMLRLLNSINDETISVIAGKNYFCLITEDYKFNSKLIEARFPPYIKAIPTNNDKFTLIEKDLLKRSLQRIMILAHEKSRAVLLHIQSSGVTLVANNQEKEEATEWLEANVDGQELKIGINASYLLDVLNILPGNFVRLSMSTTDRSILVESLENEQYQYIIMPMKL